MSRFYFFLPILVLWFRAQGFEQFQVTILLSLFFLSTTLAEIPTGILSDRIGHRQAIALSGIFQAAGVLCLAFASRLSLAVSGEILMGIGQAFYTGSKEAYLFNTLEEDQRHHLYQRDYAQAKFFEFIGMGLGSLVGGSIYVLWPRLPFFLSALAFLLAAGTALKMRRTMRRPRQKNETPPMTFEQLVSGLRKIRGAPRELKTLIAYYCLFFSSVLVFIVTLIQPYLKEAGLPLSLFGIVFFLFQTASMGGSLIARQVPSKWIGPKFFILLTSLFSLTLIGLALIRHPLVFCLAAVLYLVWGVFLPTMSHATNRLIGSASRATLLSTQDFLQNLVFVIGAPLLGLITDRYGMTSALVALSVAGFSNVLLFLNRPDPPQAVAQR